MIIRSPEAVYRELAKLHGISEQEAADQLRTGQISIHVDERSFEESLIEALCTPLTDPSITNII